MANWKHKIELNTIIRKVEDLDLEDDDNVPDDIKNEIMAELNKVEPLKTYADEISMVDTVAEVDYILEDAYLAADIHRIWCGV